MAGSRVFSYVLPSPEGLGSAFSSIDIAMGRRVGLGLGFVSVSVFDDDSENLISYQV